MSLKLKQICTVAILLCCVVLARYFIDVFRKQKHEYRHTEKNDPRNRDKFGRGYGFLDSKSQEVVRADVVQLGNDQTEKRKETLKQTMVKKETFNISRIQQGAVAQYDIILSAYQHSGSSVTGRLFGNREDTFYFYEPLWEIATHTFYKGNCLFCRDFMYTDNDNCIKVNKHCHNNTLGLEEPTSVTTDYGDDFTSKSKIWKAFRKPLEESLMFLQGIFDCKFQQFAEFFYDPALQRSKHVHMDRLFYSGSKWSEFLHCRKVKKLSLEYCLGLAEKSCNEANHRVIKSLRMTLDNVTPLLIVNPQIKVVHLFRDPRGIFSSRVGNEKLHPIDESRMRSAVKTTCERHRTDLKASETLREMYPDRFKVIQYEHLYAEPMSRGVKELYEFAGMDYDSEQQLEEQLDTTIRKESGFHPFKYRTRLPWSVVDMFNEECAEVLDRLGYTRFKNQSHLEDMSQSGFSRVW